MRWGCSCTHCRKSAAGSRGDFHPGDPQGLPRLAKRRRTSEFTRLYHNSRCRLQEPIIGQGNPSLIAAGPANTYSWQTFARLTAWASPRVLSAKKRGPMPTRLNERRLFRSVSRDGFVKIDHCCGHGVPRGQLGLADSRRQVCCLLCISVAGVVDADLCLQQVAKSVSFIDGRCASRT